MDEDVLQATLIHYIGIQCCVALKVALNSFMLHDDKFWEWHTESEPSHDGKLRRT